MSLIVTAECARAVLKHLTDTPLDLRLYVNDVDPSPHTPAAAYTEAAGHGYAPIVLAPERWTIEDGAPVVAEYPEQVFFFAGNLGLLYGYFIVSAFQSAPALAGDTGIPPRPERLYPYRGHPQGAPLPSGMQWAELFTDGPYRITNPGDSIHVTPCIELGASR